MLSGLVKLLGGILLLIVVAGLAACHHSFMPVTSR